MQYQQNWMTDVPVGDRGEEETRQGGSRASEQSSVQGRGEGVRSRDLPREQHLCVCELSLVLPGIEPRWKETPLVMVISAVFG